MHLNELKNSTTEYAHQCAPGESSVLSTKCYLGILPIGSDVPDVDHLCWGRLCLGLCIGHYLVGFVMILFSGVWVYIPFVWLVLSFIN